MSTARKVKMDDLLWINPLVDELENTSDYSDDIQNENGLTDSSNKASNNKIPDDWDPNGIKMFFIGCFTFVVILMLFFIADILLTVRSNVVYNKDPKIISTYCFRQLESRAKEKENELQVELNKLNQQQLDLLQARHEDKVGYYELKNQQFELFFVSTKTIAAKKDFIKKFEDFRAYRRRNINSETSQIKWFYAIIADLSILAGVVVCFCKKDMFFKILRMSLCFAFFLSILFFRSHLAQEIETPAKTADCPIFE
uniref:Uncharacterized protein n=1 Tax=Panagrolaimus sp. JU765 TaxID=591449 RepID=A0AC34Q295_9BILA